MTYLIFSDTHGRTGEAEKVIEQTHCDKIIHLGDCCRDAEHLERIFPNHNICMLSGNNDYFSDCPRQIVLQDGQVRIFCTHGHMLGVKTSLDILINAAAADKCTVALFGHTHTAYSEIRNGIRLLNPGSITFSGTYALLEINENHIAAEIKHIR